MYETTYFLAINGAVVGEFTAQQLTTMVAQGQIPDTAFVLPKGTAQWLTLQQFFSSPSPTIPSVPPQGVPISSYTQQVPQGQIIINTWGNAPQWQSGPISETEVGREIVKMLMQEKKCASQIVEELVQRGTDARAGGEMVNRVIAELESKYSTGIVLGILGTAASFFILFVIVASGVVQSAQGLQAILLPAGIYLVNSIQKFFKVKKLKR